MPFIGKIGKRTSPRRYSPGVLFKFEVKEAPCIIGGGRLGVAMSEDMNGISYESSQPDISLQYAVQPSTTLPASCDFRSGSFCDRDLACRIHGSDVGPRGHGDRSRIHTPAFLRLMARRIIGMSSVYPFAMRHGKESVWITTVVAEPARDGRR